MTLSPSAWKTDLGTAFRLVEVELAVHAAGPQTLGDALEQRIDDAAADGPPDFTALGEVVRRHGLTPAP
jgi:hypothetical protein